ncbi:Ankyrin repeat-containing domain [Phytophthora cactorum]|nr:Ankyrin repeat-containing domain [Phytophthora cactorum]
MKGLGHVNTAVSAYLMPLSLDAAVPVQVQALHHQGQHAALVNNHFKTLKWLVTNNKRVPESLAVNEALKLATEQGESEVAELLAVHCSDDAVEEALKYAALKGNWQIMAACTGNETWWSFYGEIDAAQKWKLDVVEVLYQHCDTESRELGVTLKEKDLVEALKVVVEQRQWDVAKLLCEKRQKKECEDALQLVNKDDGRMLLDQAIKQAAACGKHEIFHILENNYSAIAVTAALSRLSRGGDNVREMPESQPEHQTLRFFVPGFGPFEIDLSSVDTVSELKRLLHAERPDCFGDVPALSIWLFLPSEVMNGFLTTQKT